MREAVGIAVLVLVLAAVLLAMRAGWRGRARRSATLVPVLPDAPEQLGPALTEPIEATYVSTTVAGDWLDRVVAHDLGVRSSATVTVHRGGVVVARTGARDLVVPAAALRGASLEPGIAGKVVGGQGLVVLRWEAVAARGALLRGDPPARATALDTGLRPRRAADRVRLVETVTALVAAGAEGAPPDPTPAELPKEHHA